jgi:hypothetical protein
VLLVAGEGTVAEVAAGTGVLAVLLLAPGEGRAMGDYAMSRHILRLFFHINICIHTSTTMCTRHISIGSKIGELLSGFEEERFGGFSAKHLHPTDDLDLLRIHRLMIMCFYERYLG